MSSPLTSLSYEDGLHRVDWQSNASEAYHLANYQGAERQYADDSHLYQEWWPHPGPAFSNMDLSQVSDVCYPLLPRTLDAHHEWSFGENGVPTQLQQFPPCAVAAPAGGAMSTQADVSDGLSTEMGASGIAVSLQSEARASSWHTSLDALSPGALPQCNVQTFHDERTKRRKKESNADALVCPECPGKTWTRLYNLKVHIRTVHRGERPYTCPDPACTRSFSRKHDMRRHFQSRHTDMGSPRRHTFIGPTTAFPEYMPRAEPVGFAPSFKSFSSPTTNALPDRPPFPTHDS